jgi:hypothetical protein
VASAKAPWFSRSIYIGASAAAIVGLGVYFNAPIGPSTKVGGNLEGNCVPRGKQSNMFDCTAKLVDGSYQVFRHTHPFTGGTAVSFERRERRYFGRHYQLSHVAP